MQTIRQLCFPTSKIGTHRLCIAGILIFTGFWLVVIFADIINHEFLHWDDIFYFVNNPYLSKFSLSNFAWMLTDYKTINWHPLTWFSFSIDFLLYGKNPFLIKLTNILLHIANCIVLFFLFQTLLEIVGPIKNRSQNKYAPSLNTYVSLLACSFFAIHPQHIESVVWMSERKDVLCNLFYFSTMLCYLKYHHYQRTGYFHASLVLAVLATMAKPMAVSIPLALIVLDILVLNRISTTAKWTERLRILLSDKLVFFTLSIFIAVITLFTQNSAIKNLETLSIVSRIINASLASLHYIVTIIFPINLSPFYPYSETALTPTLISVWPVIALALVVAACVMLWRKGYHFYLIAISLYFVSILPVIGIVSVGDQAYADRYTYITTSLFYLAFSHSLFIVLNQPVISNVVRSLAVIAIAVIFSAFSYLSMSQVEYWRNDETLWSAVINYYPEKVYVAHQNLGNSYLVKGQYSDAIEQYLIALKLDDKAAKTHENLGRAYGYNGNKDKEIEHYLLAIKNNERAVWPRLFAGYYYLSNHNLSEASKHIRDALLVEPLSGPVVVANAKLDVLYNQPQLAKKRLQTLLDYDSNDTEAMWILAQLYATEGNLDNAEVILNKFLSLKPDDKPAIDLLAKINKLKSQT